MYYVYSPRRATIAFAADYGEAGGFTPFESAVDAHRALDDFCSMQTPEMAKRIRGDVVVISARDIPEAVTGRIATEALR